MPFAPERVRAEPCAAGGGGTSQKLSIAATSAIIAAFVDFPIEARLPSMKIPVEALTDLVSLVLARHGLSSHLHGAGTTRLPGDLRYQRRQVAERDGVEVAPAMHEYLEAEAGR